MANKIEDRCMALTGSINFNGKTIKDIDMLTLDIMRMFESSSNLREYYLIWHDETETLHCHYVLMFATQQYVKTWVNKFVDCLQIDIRAINYDKLKHRNAMLRYVLHISPDSIKDGKKKYDESAIITNISRNLLHAFVESKNDNDKLDANTLKLIFSQCDYDEFKLWEYLDTTLYSKHYKDIKLMVDNAYKIKNELEDYPF